MAAVIKHTKNLKTIVKRVQMYERMELKSSEVKSFSSIHRKRNKQMIAKAARCSTPAAARYIIHNNRRVKKTSTLTTICAQKTAEFFF